MIRKVGYILYYVAFIMTILLRLINQSLLINIPSLYYRAFLIFSLGIFIYKIILDNHTLREYLFIVLFLFIFVYISYITDTSTFLTSYLAFIGIKDINIEKSIKCDYYTKKIFLIIHILAFAIEYVFNYSNITNMILISGKGISYYLYFDNPNAVGTVWLCIILERLYLKNKITKKDYLLNFSSMFVCYFLTRCRTAFFIFIIYMILNLIKNRKILNFFTKFTYPIFTFITFCIINYVNINGILFKRINSLLSNRLSYSVSIYNYLHLNFLPNSNYYNFVSNVVVDNYYVKCFVFYGILTLILLYIPKLLIKNKNYLKEKRLFIVYDIYLFFEAAPTDIAYTPQYLLLGNLIFNKKKLNNNRE